MIFNLITKPYLHTFILVAGFINIDCGLGKNVTSVNKITGLTYVSDDLYTDTGVNSKISSQLNENYTDLLTLRSFPTNIKNCYTLFPVTKGSKYLVRAIFYYGNYDRLNKVPSFDLYFGVNFWSTVDIKTSTDWYAYEIIAIALANYTQVCLVNTGYGTPFISVLELRSLNDTLYPLANSTQSLNKIRRRDNGSPEGYYTRYAAK
jgi:Malectin-like domain